MKKTQIILLISLIIFCVEISSSSGQETTAEDIKDKKITLNLENKSLESVFIYLNLIYDVPIGLECSTLDNDHIDYVFRTNMIDRNPGKDYMVSSSFTVKKHRFTIKVKDARLEEILNKVVGEMENYKWEINDGVVNIVPIR